MKNLLIKPGSPLRKMLPLVRRLRNWAWKFHDRTGRRLVISGGRICFMDADLIFPENTGLLYSTPLFWNGPEAYEATTSRAIARLAGHSKLFLDVGSNIGIYAVYAGVKFPQVKTFAFEPVPAIWEKNRAFHSANRLSTAGVLNAALSDRDGVQKIFIPVFDTGLDEEQTATLNAVSWQAHEKKVETVEVQCLTLDTFAATHPLPAGPCLLKIDVENHEAAVLRGGRKFISVRRPWIVCEILPCEEFDPATRIMHNNNRETLALLDELDCRPFAITDGGFFRMTAADFARPRGLKDFLLVPAEKIPGDVSYLALDDLAGLFGT